MAEEAAEFDFSDVVASICEKMIRRHPHVFGDEAEREQGAQPGSWEQIKTAERAEKLAAGDSSVLDGIALNLPALKRAEKLGSRAANVGFDWPDTVGVRDKIAEELGELDEACRSAVPESINEELGDLLFSLVNFARHLDIDPEEALSSANRKFEARFRGVEAAAAKDQTPLESLDIDALELLWQAQKKIAAGNR
jgi:MazG family protein